MEKYNLFELVQTNAHSVQAALSTASQSTGRPAVPGEATTVIRGAFTKAAIETCGDKCVRAALYTAGVALCLGIESFLGATSFAPLGVIVGGFTAMMAVHNIGSAVTSASFVTRQYDEDYKIKSKAMGNSEIYAKAETIIGNYIRKKINGAVPS